MEKVIDLIEGMNNMRNELISRQAAIDALGKRPMAWAGSDYGLGARNQYDADVLALETVPSAEPERKKGKWIKPTGMTPPEYVGVCRCSECDEFAMRDWKTHKQTLTDCCPYCFADMREGEADEG